MVFSFSDGPKSKYWVRSKVFLVGIPSLAAGQRRRHGGVHAEQHTWGINLPCYTLSEIQGFSAMKATSRACGVAARNNPVSCNFSLKQSKWQRQLAGIPFSLVLNPFLPKIEARVKGGSGVKLPHMNQSESYLGRFLLPLSLCQWRWFPGFSAAFSSVQKPVMWLWSHNHGPTGLNVPRNGGPSLGSGFSCRDSSVQGRLWELDSKELTLLSSSLPLRETLSQLWLLVHQHCRQMFLLSLPKSPHYVAITYHVFLLPLYIISF